MNKVGRESFTSTSAVTITGWSSDATYPATIVSNAIDTVLSGNVTVHAKLFLGRNSVSGTPTARLVINGATVDSVDILPSSAQFGNTDPLRGRPCYLQWNGTVSSGDDIRIDGIKTTSTTGYVNEGSTVAIEVGNTTVTRQRMYKNTSAFSAPNSASIVTGWTADAKYSGSSVSSNQLATTLNGTGTAEAYVVATSGNSPIEVNLVMNGTTIGTTTIPASDQTGYWITVPGVTFDGSDLLSITARRTNSSFTRSLENDSCVVQAYI
ncbi:hypothetical protein SEA_GUEY18_65 [Gordonia phage Guey18]|nr:hypothetical protein SEA_GUEY18_65 [Gordonia phage Guey18]